LATQIRLEPNLVGRVREEQILVVTVQTRETASKSDDK
jgi:hypothetical protein